MKRKNTYKKISKETQILGYNTPLNYFENLETSILDKIELNNIEEEHQQKLGLKVPDNYFETSKKELLSKIYTKEKAVISFASLKKWYLIPVAASIAFILFFNFYNQNKAISTIAESQTEITKNSFNLGDDAMLNSLLVEDENVDDYIDKYVLNKLIIDDVKTYFVTLNDATLATLFVEDTEVDNYLNQYILEDLVINTLKIN